MDPAGAPAVALLIDTAEPDTARIDDVASVAVETRGVFSVGSPAASCTATLGDHARRRSPSRPGKVLQIWAVQATWLQVPEDVEGSMLDIIPLPAGDILQDWMATWRRGGGWLVCEATSGCNIGLWMGSARSVGRDEVFPRSAERLCSSFHATVLRPSQPRPRKLRSWELARAMMMPTIITLPTAEAVSRCLVRVLEHDVGACPMGSKFWTRGSTDGCTIPLTETGFWVLPSAATEQVEIFCGNGSRKHHVVSSQKNNSYFLRRAGTMQNSSVGLAIWICSPKKRYN